MSRKVIPMFLTLILIVSFCSCGRYDAPKSSKTFDIKSFRIENGKKIPIEPIFSKTVFEYKNEAEDKIEFVEWKPKPLLAKGELEQFFVEETSKTTEYYGTKLVPSINGVSSTPEGWYISNGEDIYLLDPSNGKKTKHFGDPFFSDQNSNLCVGRLINDDYSYDSFACWDRIKNHVYWNKKTHFPKPIILDNSLYYSDGYYREIINKINPTNGLKEFFLKEKEPYKVNNSWCASTTDNIWFPCSRLYKEQSKDILIRYDTKNDEAYISEIEGIEDGFTYNDKYYYYNNLLQIFEVDKDSMKSTLHIDMSKYLPDNIPLRESILHTLDGDILLIENYKIIIAVNIKTKKVLEPKGNMEFVFGRNIYFQNYHSAWGVDPEIWGINSDTFEKSWHIKIPPNLILPKVLLIDERGVLVSDQNHIFGFRPKK